MHTFKKFDLERVSAMAAIIAVYAWCWTTLATLPDAAGRLAGMWAGFAHTLYFFAPGAVLAMAVADLVRKSRDRAKNPNTQETQQ